MAPESTDMRDDGTTTTTADDESKYQAYDLITQLVPSMVLNTVLELGVPDVIAKGGGKPMSTTEILAQLPTESPTPGPRSNNNLGRLLRLLARNGFFSESFDEEKRARVYGLTKISKWFIKGNPFNVIAYAGLNTRPELNGAWLHLHKAILSETKIPFAESNGGMSLYELTAQNSEFKSKFENFLEQFGKHESVALMNCIENSGSLENVKTVVDIGGSLGSTVAEIVARNPHIHGVNFDLPHVISGAPSIHGVEHVGGSFFTDVLPSGDVMLLKWIVHNQSDEDATRILQNCHRSLPVGGKVMIVEYLLSDGVSSSKSRWIDKLDICMMQNFNTGMERTEEHYREIIRAAGFSRIRVIRGLGCADVIEAWRD